MAVSLNENINFNSLKKYRIIIVGEIHSRVMIDFYDKLLSSINPEYFIAEMAYGDVCLTQDELKDRLYNASDGTMESKCDYQLNYWLYKLAYDHNVKLIGCDIDEVSDKSRWGKLSKGLYIENTFKKRETHMLDVIKKYDTKKCVVQLGDAHLRSIPWTAEFQEWSEGKKMTSSQKKESCVSYSSCIWDYYIDNPNVMILRDPNDYRNELKWTESSSLEQLGFESLFNDIV